MPPSYHLEHIVLGRRSRAPAASDLGYGQSREIGSRAAALQSYSKRIRTISGVVPTRMGGPQVPAPEEV